MKKITIKQIFERLEARNPKPQTELIFNSPFQLLVAVILSAQTTDKAVNKVTPELFKIAPCASSLARLPVEKVEGIISGIGLYKKKAKFIVETSDLLIKRYGGDLPASREELEKLPGVGQKTAGVVLNIVFQQNEIAVDTHVFRVSTRLGLADTRNIKKLENQLNTIVPNCYKLNAHNLLLLHGRYICKAKSPSCSSCFLKDLCNFGKQRLMIN